MTKKPTTKRQVHKNPTQIVRDAAAKAEAAAKREEAKTVSKKRKSTVKKVSKAPVKAKNPIPANFLGKRAGAAPRNSKKPKVALAGEAPAVVMTQAEAEKAMDELPMQWQLYIENFLSSRKKKESAVRAGYAAESAQDTSNWLHYHPRIKPLIDALEKDVVARVRMTRERIIDEYAAMAEADATELSEHLRVPCRHCWGRKVEDSGAQEYQLTPVEWETRRDQWEKDRLTAQAENRPDPGEFPLEMGNWYDKRKAINPDCAECHGFGYSETYLKDTRNLSRHARAIYAGTEEGKDGIKIKTWSKESALGVLAKNRKVFDDSVNINVGVVSSAELDAIYNEKLSKVEDGKSRLIGRGEGIRAGVREDESNH